jgi:hypothetical protein
MTSTPTVAIPTVPGPTAPGPIAPIAAPVAQPVHAAAQPADAAAAAGDASFEPVQADTVVALLDEQEREDRAMFRGLRRSMRRMPDIREILAFMATHKLVVTVVLLSLFVVAELFRGGPVVAAIFFAGMSLGVIYLGVAEATAAGTLFQASAWCYLIVLVAFPIVLSHREELGIVGGKVLSNPTRLSQAQRATPTGSVPQAPPEFDAPEAPQANALEAAAPGEPMPGEPLRDGGAAPAVDDTAAVTRPAAESFEPDASSDAPPTVVPSPTMPVDSAVASPAIQLPEAAPLRMMDVSREDVLRQHADRSFADGDMTGGMHYLYACALAHPTSTVWTSIRWSPLLSRPVLAVRFGAAVQLDDMASQITRIPVGEHPGAMRGSLESQRLLGTAFARETENLGGPLVITWLRQSYDDGKLGDLDLIRAPSERALRGCTYLAADTGSEMMRAARAQELDLILLFDIRGVQNAGSAPGLSASVRVVDVANRRDLDLHAAKPRGLPAGRAQLAKDVDVTLKTLGKEAIFGDAPTTVDPQAIETRVRDAAARASENRLPLLAELMWYARDNRLPSAKVQEYLGLLVGQEGAKALSTGSAADRAALVGKWLPRRTD